MGKYVAVRVPKEVYKNLLERQEKMQKVIRVITRKSINIPLTKVLKAITENPVYISDKYILKLLKEKVRKI